MSADKKTPTEIYAENIRLRTKLEQSRYDHQDDELGLDNLGSMSDVTDDSIEERQDVQDRPELPLQGNRGKRLFTGSRIEQNKSRSFWRWRNYIVVGLVLLAVTAITVTYFSFYTRNVTAMLGETAAKGMAMSMIRDVMPGTLDLNIGMRQDFRLQDCNKNNLKESFPDFDYSLMGYNILRGFPMATGHDPGFTYPIFVADYSTMRQSADCRFSIPEGFIAVPDVSCMTSFSSKTIQSSYEFSKELGVSANVGGGGWGVSFSASAGYKESSSQVSSGESVFILSTAQCNYYFTKLIQDQPPKFQKVFVDWIYKLNASIPNNTDTVFMNFLDLYGTHFPTMVTYGARYTYQHKMTSSTFKKEQSKGVNVAVQAGYSGIMSVSGGFSLDSSQREAASEFQKNVETKTFTVGAAPPANGDAMTWASEVKNSPVPTKYDLSMISDLFTDHYMGDLSVDFNTVRKTLVDMIPTYCALLKRKGLVETCEMVNEGIYIKEVRLFNHYKSLDVDSEITCLDNCIEEEDCDAMTFCLDCQWSSPMCFFFTETDKRIYAQEEGRAESEKNWKTTILPSKIKNTLMIVETKIEGIERSADQSSEKRFTVEECQNLCVADEHCVAFSHCQCWSKLRNCFMYSKSNIVGLKKDKEFVTYFISDTLTTTTSTTTTSTTTTSTTTTTSSKTT